MLPFGFGFVFEIAAAFLTLPDDACLPAAEEGGGLLDFVFVAAMAKGFDGGGTEGGTASVNGVLEEVAPGDGGRPTSGCFREESRGLRNMCRALACSRRPVQDGRWPCLHSS